MVLGVRVGGFSTLVAEIELIYKPAISEKPMIKSCLEAYNVIRNFIPENTIALKEHMVVLYLNQAQRVIGAYIKFLRVDLLQLSEI